MQNDGAKSPFLNRVREVIRTRHYSVRTEQSYVHWVKRFILFHGKRHPSELGETEVAASLTHLAVNRQVSPSTRNQVLNALVFLYRYVLDRPLGDILDAVRTKRPERLPNHLDESCLQRATKLAVRKVGMGGCCLRNWRPCVAAPRPRLPAPC